MKTITVKEVTGHYGTGYMPVCKTAYILSHLKSGNNMTAVFTDNDLRNINKLGYSIIKTN